MKQIPKVDSFPFELFLDIDGVFANFEKRIEQLTGKKSRDITSSQLWKAVYRDKDFFLALELMEDAHYLWEYTAQAHPKFLTGAPSSQIAREHKKQWILEKEHVLPNGDIFTFMAPHDIEVIVLPRKEKKLYAHSRAVLVDDRQDNIDQWVDAGGIGVLHVEVWKTIATLESLRTTL